MGFLKKKRRFLIFPCLLAVFGCTSPTPQPSPKPKSSAVTPSPQLPQPAPAAIPSTHPAPPSPTKSNGLVLSDGPWTQCAPSDATIAVVVTLHTNGLFRERTGVHFLRPARTTTYRLVQVRASLPVTLAQKEVPEACSSTFHLSQDTDDPPDSRYSIHSTLKQIPVDPSHAIILHLRVNHGSEHLDESIALNGLGHADCSRGPIAANIAIVPPETASNLLANSTRDTELSENNKTSDWDLLHRQFQLTGQESRVPGWFQLTQDASLQFPDIHFSSDQIQINEEHSLIKLHGPVHIEWDGHSYTSGDALIRVSPETVQYESSNIQENGN